MMKRVLLRILLLWQICLCTSAADDAFDSIKKQLAQAECTRFDFVSIIESDIFDAIDSATGAAYIAHDGRFNVSLGNDRYLFDLCFLYSYSAENNQVVVEKVPDQKQVSREISFITRLDELYETHVIHSGKSYRLLRKPDTKSDIPDSVIVFIAPDALQLDRLEYLDINEERNVIVIKKQETSKDCNDRQFEPAFPDSVERIRL